MCMKSRLILCTLQLIATKRLLLSDISCLFKPSLLQKMVTQVRHLLKEQTDRGPKMLACIQEVVYGASNWMQQTTLAEDTLYALFCSRQRVWQNHANSRINYNMSDIVYLI